MKYFVNLLVILAIMAFGYAFSSFRYTALGCRRATRWDDRFARCLQLLLVATAVPSIIMLVYAPAYRFASWCSFEHDEAIFWAVVDSIVVIALFGVAIARLTAAGEHNSKIHADHATRICLKKCRHACEWAGWGETVLDCCQNLSCSCPLAAEYDIHIHLHAVDVLAAYYKEMSRQRQLRRQGQPVPTAVYLDVPQERVLIKEFAAEGWHDGLSDLFKQSEPIDTTAKVIPFPGQSARAGFGVAVNPEPASTKLEELAPAHRAKFRKVAINLKDRSVMVQDCGDHLLLRMRWVDENGQAHTEEYTLDKNSPDCPCVINDIAALNANAAYQIERMAIPTATSRG